MREEGRELCEIERRGSEKFKKEKKKGMRANERMEEIGRR